MADRAPCRIADRSLSEPDVPARLGARMIGRPAAARTHPGGDARRTWPDGCRTSGVAAGRRSHRFDPARNARIARPGDRYQDAGPGLDAGPGPGANPGLDAGDRPMRAACPAMALLVRGGRGSRNPNARAVGPRNAGDHWCHGRARGDRHRDGRRGHDRWVDRPGVGRLMTNRRGHAASGSPGPTRHRPGAGADRRHVDRPVAGRWSADRRDAARHPGAGRSAVAILHRSAGTSSLWGVVDPA
jgi:hypothetical protein